MEMKPVVCEHCRAEPFWRLPRKDRWLSWVCYHIALHWPHRWFANKAHLAILPWAGNYAYSCHCAHPNKDEAGR